MLAEAVAAKEAGSFPYPPIIQLRDPCRIFCDAKVENTLNSNFSLLFGPTGSTSPFSFITLTSTRFAVSGLQAVLLLRHGNAPLPSDHGFRTAKSLLELWDKMLTCSGDHATAWNVAVCLQFQAVTECQGCSIVDEVLPLSIVFHLKDVLEILESLLGIPSDKFVIVYMKIHNTLQRGASN